MNMNILAQANQSLAQHQDLSFDQMCACMQAIFSGDVDEPSLIRFIQLLSEKGETVTELVAAVHILRELSVPVHVPGVDNLIDIVGTGGDGHNTFNISTLTAIVAASAGAKVAKHGNKASSSLSGSADVLAQAGVNLDMPETAIADCIQTCGIGFLFAPHYHPALKQVARARKILKTRSIFNLLGPLLNPADAKYHLIGVFAKKWMHPIAETLQALGNTCAWVAHAHDGLDEISIHSPTDIVILKDNHITEKTITPEQFGLPRSPLTDLATESSHHSLQMIEAILANQPLTLGSYHIVLLNTAAALHIAGLSGTISDGIEMAKQAIESGKAQQTWRKFIAYTQDKST